MSIRRDDSVTGKIVEIEDRPKELFVVIAMNNYEDAGSCSYDREYYITPYRLHMDIMAVDLCSTEKIKVKGVEQLPVKVREDKKPYTQFGYSNMRGVEKLYFERRWEDIVTPNK